MKTLLIALVLCLTTSAFPVPQPVYVVAVNPELGYIVTSSLIAAIADVKEKLCAGEATRNTHGTCQAASETYYYGIFGNGEIVLLEGPIGSL